MASLDGLGMAAAPNMTAMDQTPATDEGFTMRWHL